jgi:hypothetical protein
VSKNPVEMVSTGSHLEELSPRGQPIPRSDAIGPNFRAPTTSGAFRLAVAAAARRKPPKNRKPPWFFQKKGKKTAVLDSPAKGPRERKGPLEKTKSEIVDGCTFFSRPVANSHFSQDPELKKQKQFCSPEHRQTREVAAPVEIRQRERWSIEHSLLVCTLEEKAFFGLLHRQLEVQVEVASVLSFLVAEK